jgi:glyoxylase-like metal-dependent hydrolase (beta-lactamase superfamily II)
MSGLHFNREFDVRPGEAVAVSPLIRRVLADNPGPFTFKGTSTFIVGKGSVAVIDPGPDDEPHLAALLHALRGETVSHILVTHSHADHSPLAAKLKAATGAKTYAYGGVSPDHSSGLRLDASIDHDFVPDVTLADGDTVTGAGWTLAALFTPGHMSNHMCFALREDNALFAGDHVMAWSTSVIAPPDGNMRHYFASLRKLLERGERVYHPAHGPSQSDPLPLVRGYLAHRRMRETAILGRVTQGAHAIHEIVALIYADVDPRLHAAAALSTRAHLDHLIEQGKLRHENGRYEAV